MSELKTLKEIEANNPIYLKELIKEEAIKWMKEYNYDKMPEMEVFDMAEVIPWIKYFFNIPEENLK